MRKEELKPDVRDVTVLIGLCLLAGGMYLIWPPGALIVPGLIITAIGIFS